jgi:hypothetical protein
MGDPVCEAKEGPQEGLQRAIEKLESEVRRGVAHGFFKLTLTCEVVNGGKRRLIIRAGKSFQFMISENEGMRASKIA